MAKDDIPRLADKFGIEALAWLLATDAVSVRAWRNGIVEPPGTAAAVAGLLTQLIEKLPEEPHGSFALGQALGMDAGDGLTMGAAIRTAAGGSIDAPESDDPLLSPLLKLAAQLAGVHLLRPDADSRMFVGTVGITVGIGNALFDEVIAVASQTLPLERWTGDGDIVQRSSGGGGPFNTQILPSQLLTDASARWQFGPDWPCLDDFYACVAASVDAFRRVIDGRSVQVPALLGVMGLRVPEEGSASLPWGRLRGLRPHELDRLHAGEVRTVLETTVPFRICCLPVKDLARGHLTFPDALREALMFPVRAVRDTLFSAQLAGIQLPPSATTHAFRVITDPIQGVPQSSYSSSESGGWIELSRDHLSALEKWSALYRESHHKSMDVAVRRAVAAAGRAEPSDSFVDAVIGWDNLFGSAAGESQLRIASSFALLLESELSGRRELVAQVKADYDLRSRLVHGDLSDLPTTDTGDAPRRALDLLLRAIRKLYTERTDLLAMNSGQRSQALLLGES